MVAIKQVADDADVIILKFYNNSGKMIHRIVLFLKFAPSSEDF